MHTAIEAIQNETQRKKFEGKITIASVPVGQLQIVYTVTKLTDLWMDMLTMAFFLGIFEFNTQRESS